MSKKWIRKGLKIVGLIFLILFIILGFLIYNFTSPKSDKDIVELFEGAVNKPVIKYKNFKGNKVRMIWMQQEIDSKLPVVVFVHGSPGSSMDFKRYLMDEDLNKMANLVSYDRIGFSNIHPGEVLNSLDEEVELMHSLIEEFDNEEVILVGYSYGGTVVMASERDYKKKLVLAAAVKGELEPMFWALNFYKWPLTRPMVPEVFKAATIQKLRHVKELPLFEHKWNLSEASVLAIHGKEDLIVPYKNSLFLMGVFDNQKFELISLEEGNHSLIWTNFDLIKAELVKIVMK